MTLAINLEQLSNSRALVRKRALRALCENLAKMSDEDKSAIFAAACRALRDESRIVQREAIKTLLSFAPDEVPEELASLRMETLDEKMRSLAHG
ncbi:MAG: hypothetical protein HY564_02090, partial [Candidatus Jacksonbacteria bacterium]|nr:hypothetical protein [Candidatus Jacksonbacteria bacterium]